MKSPALAPLMLISSDGWAISVSRIRDTSGSRVRKDIRINSTIRMMFCGSLINDLNRFCHDIIDPPYLSAGRLFRRPA